MLRANFFFKFFQQKKNNREIVQYNLDKSFPLQNQISFKIESIDQEIKNNSKDLVEAQIIKFKSTFSRSNNFIVKMGKNIHQNKLDESISWYQKNLKELYLQRRQLEITLEKLKGIFWLNRIKRILKIIVIAFLMCLILFIFLSGFMIIIYLMPFIILIFLGYWMSKKIY